MPHESHRVDPIPTGGGGGGSGAGGWNYTDALIGKEVFPSGAQRKTTSTDYSQFSHVAARLHAETQAEGNTTYGYGNWQRGIPVSNLLSHALAHIFAILNGDVSENHMGHAIWNLDKAAHFIETRPDLIDILPLRKALKMEEL